MRWAERATSLVLPPQLRLCRTTKQVSTDEEKGDQGQLRPWAQCDTTHKGPRRPWNPGQFDSWGLSYISLYQKKKGVHAKYGDSVQERM